MRLASRQLLEQISPLRGAYYVQAQDVQMMGPCGFSADNGETWVPFEPQVRGAEALPYGYRRIAGAAFVDPSNGALLRIFNALDTPGLDPLIGEPPIGLRSYYLRYRVSTDGGRSYHFDEPIVQAGHGPRHPVEGVWVGKNAMFLGDAGSCPIRTQTGNILVPVQVCTLGEDGELSSPGGGFTYTDALVLLGRWVGQTRLTWQVSQRIAADPSRSTRGMIEPTLAELPDGRILCVMRGSNGGSQDSDFQIPSYRWHSLSTDGGVTWSQPQPWTWDDGTPFYSPSSMSQLLTHSSGRLLWLGNIAPANCRGNAPRYPLVIGEVDTARACLLRRTLLVIDTRDHDWVGDFELSNFHAFEDRQTGHVVVPMGRWKGASGETIRYEPVVYRIDVVA